MVYLVFTQWVVNIIQRKAPKVRLKQFDSQQSIVGL